MSAQITRPPPTDYSAAVAKAIAWLGDRYLLARPINVTAGRCAVLRRLAAATSDAIDPDECAGVAR